MRKFPPVANKKVKKSQQQTFNELLDNKISALETLKGKLVEPLVLSLSNSQGAYTVDTDACNMQKKYVLQQKQPEGTDRTI